MNTNPSNKIQLHARQVRIENGFIWIDLFCFAPGCRSVSWNGIHLFDFTRTQAKIISLLLEHLENGFPNIPQYEIIRHLNDLRFSDNDDSEDQEMLSENVRLRGYFRLSNNKVHPAWQKLICTTKGRDSRMFLDFGWMPIT